MKVSRIGPMISVYLESLAGKVPYIPLLLDIIINGGIAVQIELVRSNISNSI